MSTDYDNFWSAVSVLASTFRHDDPHFDGNIRDLSDNLRSLPPDRQAAIRNDLQLLLVHFATLPTELNGHNVSAGAK
jgi:hypothetical protein